MCAVMPCAGRAMAGKYAFEVLEARCSVTRSHLRNGLGGFPWRVKADPAHAAVRSWDVTP